MLRIGWLFPSLTSTYGDRGNIICLTKRARWHKLQTEVIPILETTSIAEIHRIDLFVGGGSPDKEQEIMLHLLRGKLGSALRSQLEKGIPGLLVCSSLQIMGRSYQIATGKHIQGIGFFDCETLYRAETRKSRFTGTLIFEVTAPKLLNEIPNCPLIIGFENHGNATYLAQNQAFGRVVQGFGNNGEDKTEGIFHCNVIGTYAHGPILPKNPFLADWLLSTAFQVKYKETFELQSLPDPLNDASRQVVLERLFQTFA